MFRSRCFGMYGVRVQGVWSFRGVRSRGVGGLVVQESEAQGV